MEGPMGCMTMANGMVEMERHSSVHLPPGAPTGNGKNEVINPGMTGF
jgi:hypothetical protein